MFKKESHLNELLNKNIPYWRFKKDIETKKNRDIFGVPREDLIEFLGILETHQPKYLHSLVFMRRTANIP